MSDFDARARTWDTDPSKLERALHVAEVIRRELPVTPSTTVFEYGCGTGLLGFALQPHVGHVTLADASHEMLEVVREKIAAAGARNVTPLQLDLLAAPLPPDRYDLVCTLLTLHHIPDTDAILERFHALLVLDGWVGICDLVKEDGSFHGPGFEGHNGFDRADLAQRIERAGFRNVRFTTPHDIVKSTAHGTRRYPLFLAMAQRA